jgi:hypothetical protein
MPPEGSGPRLASAGPFFAPRALAVPCVAGQLPAFATHALRSVDRPMVHTKRLFGCNRLSARVTGRSGAVGRSVALALAFIQGLAGCQAPHPPPPQAEPKEQPGSTLTSPPQTSTSPEPTSVASTLPTVPTSPAVAARPVPASPLVHLANGIVVDRQRRRVEVPAHVAQTIGFLEQVACGVDSREHESLLVIESKASEVHAALLLAHAVPGQPGRWRWDGAEVKLEKPSGDAIRVRVRAADPLATPDPDTGRSPIIERDISDWIRGADGRSFPGAWVFAGSRFAPNPPSWKEPGEHYVADFTGSIVGLVTFGDETVGATTVIPDAIDIEAANWEAWTSRMPPSGSEAVLIFDVTSDGKSAAKP